jgi:hypothetical protein
MATKKRVKRYNGDDESMVNAPNRGIADQTEEEAANEAEMMPRRRAILEGERDEKALPAGYKVEAEAPAKAPAKSSTVTKEQLAKSGLSLRDYMNKQQGLTRRGDSAPASRSNPNFSNEGRSSRSNPNYSNEGRSSTAAKSGASASYSNEGKGDSKYRKVTMTPESQALEGVHPEQYFMPGVGLKTVANVAKALANRGGANTLRKVSQEALPAPTRQIAYDKAGAMARQRAARAEGRNAEMLSENARRSGVTPGSAGAESLRKNLGGDDFSLGMKRGGAAKKMASGGSVSSASSRADGIATKGKTRGKMC